MKINIITVIVILLSGCSNIQRVDEVNAGVNTFLDEIHSVIDEVDAQIEASSASPPFN